MTASIISEGTNVTSPKTETSPLKENVTRNYSCPYKFPCYSDDHSGSLKTIVVMLFGTTGAITLALLTQVYYGEYQIAPHGGVSCDSNDCSIIGIGVLKKGGNAVDAAVATSFCLGVTNFHKTGLGGGGYMIIYNHKKQRVVDVIDFREILPFSFSSTILEENVSDGLTVGVPGFVKGLWEAHVKHGNLPWKDVIRPSVELAKYGFKVSESLASSMSHLKSVAYNSQLVNLLSKLRQGHNVSMPELATTLDMIASKGAQVFYNGSIATDIVYSVKLANGNISLDDLALYKASRGNILKTRIEDFEIIVPGSSSGGALLLNSLDAVEILDLDQAVDTQDKIILKISDTLHDTYLSFLQKRNAYIRQPETFASHVSVVDSEENYVAVVSGLNSLLGSQILTNTGFILNNAIASGGINEERRPTSLASPVIVIHDSDVCGRRFVLGSGDVISATQLLINLLIFKRNTSESIESPRFAIDNIPRHLILEGFHSPQFDVEAITTLKELMKIENRLPPYQSINIIEKAVDSVFSYADSRGGGKAVIF